MSLTVSEILPVRPATSVTGAELMITNSPFWICAKLALIFSNATFSESPLPAVVLTDSKGIAGSFLNWYCYTLFSKFGMNLTAGKARSATTTAISIWIIDAKTVAAKFFYKVNGTTK